MTKLILAIDIGTSAVKASIFDTDLRIIDSSSVEYPTYFPENGAAEQDAQDWWKSACRAVGIISARHAGVLADIAAIGVSGHMLGLLPVDKDGNPLMRSMIHADSRASEETQMLADQFGIEQIYNWTGNVLSPAASLPKAMWFHNKFPDLYAQTHAFLQAKDYMVMKLTGGVFSTDYSDASHGLFLNLEKMDYMTDVFTQVGLDSSKFPALHKSHDIVGHLCAAASKQMGLPEGIPVAAGGGDGACANVGAGLAVKGDIYCSLGTTAWIAFNSADQFRDEQRRVFNIVSLDGESFGVFGTMQSAGRSVSWAQDIFGLTSPREFDERAQTVPAGSDGLIFLPYLEGERSPIFDSEARGVFFGMSISQNTNNFLRATLEGVAFALASILDVSRNEITSPVLRIIGGGAKSSLWKQIIADICERDIADLSVPAAAVTSLGAAVAAGVGVGIFPGYAEAVKNISIKAVIKYIPENTKLYAKNKEKYARLYPQLKEIYHM